MSRLHRSLQRMYVRGVGAVGMGDAQGDLSTFNQFIANGDGAQAQSMFDTAVVAYQTAGQMGADTLGPEIDVQTGGTSKPLTGQAWDINTNLAATTNSGASQQDARMAQGFVRQMQNLYQTAIALSPSSGSGPGGGNMQPSSALQQLASTLIAYLQANGCTTSSIQACLDFQKQYNLEGQIHLAEDGKYGRATQGAVQRILDVTGAGGSAPASCFARPAPKPGNTPIPSGPSPAPSGIASASMMPWGTIAVAGAAVVGAAAIAYAVQKRKGGRGIGHHMRRHMHRGVRHLRRLQARR